jgi:hypothetical protein
MIYGTDSQKLRGGGAVMRLTGGQGDLDRAPLGIHQSMDLGAQAATGTSHATIATPFLPLAPCW